MFLPTISFRFVEPFLNDSKYCFAILGFLLRHFFLAPFSDLCSLLSSSHDFSFHLPFFSLSFPAFPLLTLTPPHSHFMFPVILHFSLHFPYQSSILLFPSILVSIPLSFTLFPFQLFRRLHLFLPTFPTPTCSLTFIYSSSSLVSFPLTFALFSHFIHSFPVFFTLLLLLYLCPLASSFFLSLLFPFAYFFLRPI